MDDHVLLGGQGDAAARCGGQGAPGEAHRAANLDLAIFRHHIAVFVHEHPVGVDQEAVLVDEVTVLVHVLPRFGIGLKHQGLDIDTGAGVAGAAGYRQHLFGPHEAVDHDQSGGAYIHRRAFVRRFHQPEDLRVPGLDGELPGGGGGERTAAGGVHPQDAVAVHEELAAHGHRHRPAAHQGAAPGDVGAVIVNTCAAHGHVVRHVDGKDRRVGLPDHLPALDFGAGVYRAHQVQVPGGDGDLAVFLPADQLDGGTDLHQAAGRKLEEGRRPHQDAHLVALAIGQRVVAGGDTHPAEGERANGGDHQALAGGVHQQGGVVHLNRGVGTDEQGAGHLDVAVDGGGAVDVDLHLEIVRSRGEHAAAYHSGHLNVVADEADEGAGLHPAAFFLDDHVAGGGTNLKQVQPHVAGPHLAVDGHVVVSGDEDPPAAAHRGDHAGAGDADAYLAAYRLGTGAQDDVPLGLQATLNGQGVVRVDGHAGPGAVGDHVALDDAVDSGVECDGAVHRLQAPRVVEIDVHPVTGDAAVEVDGRVPQHHAGDVELTVGSVGGPDVDHRAGPGGVDGVVHAGHRVTGGQVVRQPQEVGVDGILFQLEGIRAREEHARVAKRQVNVAFTLLVRVGGSHGVIDIVRLRHRVLSAGQGFADIGHQGIDNGVISRAGRTHGHRRFDLEVDTVDPHMQGDVPRQPPVGGDDESVGLDLVLVGRRQDGEGAGSVEVDAAVIPPGGEHHRAVEQNPHPGVVGAPVRRIRLHGIDPADEIDGLSRPDVLADPDLVVSLDPDGGVAVEGGDGPPQVLPVGIKALGHVAARHQQAPDIGVLPGLDDDGPVGVVGDDLAGPVNLDPDSLGIGAAAHGDGFAGPQAAASLDGLAAGVDGESANIGLALGGNDQL